MDDLVKRADEALEGVTPGPWEWGGYPNNIRLQTVHHGKRFVMDFVRRGLSGAQPRFQPTGRGMVKAEDLLQFQVGDRRIVGEAAARADDSVYRYDVRGIDAPDARFIAAARELVPAMRDRIEADATRIAELEDSRNRLDDRIAELVEKNGQACVRAETAEDRAEAAEARVRLLEDALVGSAAALAAAISLLERGGKKAAPSDKMFLQMLDDYRQALNIARAALEGDKTDGTP